MELFAHFPLILKAIYLIWFFSIFILLYWVLLVAGGLLSCGMQTPSCSMHVGSSSLTRDRTWAPCVGSVEYYPLCHQGSPRNIF